VSTFRLICALVLAVVGVACAARFLWAGIAWRRLPRGRERLQAFILCAAQILTFTALFCYELAVRAL
jgi:hypothetical protein